VTATLQNDRARLSDGDACDHGSPQADRGVRFNPTSASPNLRQNPHSARGTAPAYVPRFRALALFGRRPQDRVDSVGIPASKNLHRSSHPIIGIRAAEIDPFPRFDDRVRDPHS
jgi:hypothetical protein